MDVISNVGFQAVAAICSQHKPDFERTEAARERNLPVTVVNDLTGV